MNIVYKVTIDFADEPGVTEDFGTFDELAARHKWVEDLRDFVAPEDEKAVRRLPDWEFKFVDHDYRVILTMYTIG